MYTNCPMGLALLIIFMFVAFFLTTLLRRWIDIPMLIAVAIGCAVNANIFNPLTGITAPIVVGPFTFSMEIVLYTLFMYTIMIRVLDYSYYDGKIMTLTSVAAIIISAFIELIAKLTSSGDVSTTFIEFAYYLISCVGTALAVWLMIFITIHSRDKKVPAPLIIGFALVASSIAHSAVYYGGIMLIKQDWLYTLSCLYGALLGKGVCILLAMFSYLVNLKWWKPPVIIAREKEERRKLEAQNEDYLK